MKTRTEQSGQSDPAEPAWSPISDPAPIPAKHETMLHSLYNQQSYYTSQRLEQLSTVLQGSIRNCHLTTNRLQPEHPLFRQRHAFPSPFPLLKTSPGRSVNVEVFLCSAP